MKKYERIMKKYEGNMKKYEGNMKEYMENMKEISRNIIQAVGLRKIPGLPAGGGESYADADTIPQMAPSTEKEGGSPANRDHVSCLFSTYLLYLNKFKVPLGISWVFCEDMTP